MRNLERAVVVAFMVTTAALACSGESNDFDEPVAGRGGTTSGAANAGAMQGGTSGTSGTTANAGGAASAGRAGGTSGGNTGAGGRGGTSATAGNGTAGESVTGGTSAGAMPDGGTGGAPEGGEGGTETAAGGSAGEAAGGAPSGLVSCDPRLIMCRRAAPACAEGEVPSVSGICYGPCVPIERCECDEPAACPNEQTYTCHNSAGRCGPYVR